MATWPVFAFMPTDRGVSIPHTVWSDMGVKGTVSGRVVTSLDQTKGVDGAYVALVNANNLGQEYYNTTTDASGNYRFTGVNSTYSTALQKGPDGTGGSYPRGTGAYMIYANISTGEGYSGVFGVDTNHTNSIVDTIVIYAGLPNPEDFATPEPTATAQPTAAVTPAPATATPTAAPAGPLSIGLLLVAAVLAILVIAPIAAYFLFLKKKK
ncbi:MAG TPA: hypothetical protein VMC61_01595 [Methanocella sp.]|nr:hypothetical protein [Methanocella sp.]